MDQQHSGWKSDLLQHRNIYPCLEQYQAQCHRNGLQAPPFHQNLFVDYRGGIVSEAKTHCSLQYQQTESQNPKDRWQFSTFHQNPCYGSDHNYQNRTNCGYSGGWQYQQTESQNPKGRWQFSPFQQNSCYGSDHNYQNQTNCGYSGGWQYQQTESQSPIGGWQFSPSFQQNSCRGSDHNYQNQTNYSFSDGWRYQQNQFGGWQAVTSQANWNNSSAATFRANQSNGGCLQLQCQNLCVNNCSTLKSIGHQPSNESNTSGPVVTTTFLEPEVSRESDVNLVFYGRNEIIEEGLGRTDADEVDANAANEDDIDSYGDELRLDYDLTQSVNIGPKYKLGCDNRFMSVKTSTDSKKKYCCPFCDKMYFHLPRHLEDIHRGEPDVQRFLSFPKRSKQRNAIQASLRNIGALNFNMSAELNNGELFTSRRPNPKSKKSSTDFITCPYCFAPLAISGLAYHVKNKCRHAPVPDERTDGERVTTSLATAVEARHHEDASPALKKVLSRLRGNNIVRDIRFDWMVIVYGNKLTSKYTKRNSPEMIRNRIRLIGRVLGALKNIEPNITDLAGLYNPKYYDRVVESIRAVARVDTVRNEFVAPATASSAVTAIRQIGELLLVEYIKRDDQENQRLTRDFLTVMNSDMHISINKMVNETQSRKARQKKVTLPSSEDVKRLSEYIEARRAKCFAELSESYLFKKWVELTELTMVSIIVFNRRRVGDTQNILDEDFSSKVDMNQNPNEMLSSLPESSIKIANQFSRMKVRGKKNRTVPVLLKVDVVSCLELIIAHRQDAGISSENMYLFALPSKTDNSKVVNAGRILKKFSNACGAKNPELLTATNLRKHLATICVTMQLNDTAVADIAEFMGHAEKVHREYYRQNTIDRQIVQMSQVLEAAQGNQTISADRKRKTPPPDCVVPRKSQRVGKPKN